MDGHVSLDNPNFSISLPKERGYFCHFKLVKTNFENILYHYLISFFLRISLNKTNPYAHVDIVIISYFFPLLHQQLEKHLERANLCQAFHFPACELHL